MNLHDLALRVGLVPFEHSPAPERYRGQRGPDRQKRRASESLTARAVSTAAKAERFELLAALMREQYLTGYTMAEYDRARNHANVEQVLENERERIRVMQHTGQSFYDRHNKRWNVACACGFTAKAKSSLAAQRAFTAHVRAPGTPNEKPKARKRRGVSA